MLKRHMNLRSESRECEGNPLGLMNQFQKNPFTWSPSISTRVRRWEMVALTLSTPVLQLSALWVWSKKTNPGTETRKSWLRKSVQQKRSGSLPFHRRSRDADPLLRFPWGRHYSLMLLVHRKALLGHKGPWVHPGCRSSAHWPCSLSRML